MGWNRVQARMTALRQLRTDRDGFRPSGRRRNGIAKTLKSAHILVNFGIHLKSVGF